VRRSRVRRPWRSNTAAGRWIRRRSRTANALKRPPNASPTDSVAATDSSQTESPHQRTVRGAAANEEGSPPRVDLRPRAHASPPRFPRRSVARGDDTLRGEVERCSAIHLERFTRVAHEDEDRMVVRGIVSPVAPPRFVALRSRPAVEHGSATATNPSSDIVMFTFNLLIASSSLCGGTADVESTRGRGRLREREHLTGTPG
jgi:hypothetical protein